jgi:hypothetical protein
MMPAVVAMTMTVMAPASAGGPSNTNLAARGWDCGPAGPSGFIHCFSPGSFNGKTATVIAFDSTDVAVNGDRLSAELPIGADVCNGQPCMTEGGDPYYDFTDVPGIPSYACHHYDA